MEVDAAAAMGGDGAAASAANSNLHVAMKRVLGQSSQSLDPIRAPSPATVPPLRNTDFAKAIAEGKFIDVCLSVHRGVNVNHSGYRGRTPLHKAVGSQNLSKTMRLNLASLLLSVGATPDVSDQDGNTALHMAARQRTPGVVELLLAAGADPLIRNKVRCLSDCAAVECEITIETKIHALLAFGRTAKVKDNTGKLTHMLVLQRNETAISVGQSAATRQVRADGIGGSGSGPTEPATTQSREVLLEQLQTGVISNDAVVVQQVLSASSALAIVNELNAEGCSCLHLACVHGLKEVTSLLIMHGATVNILSTQADTPLHYATFAKHTDIVHVLLAAGADPTMQNHDGVSSIDVASEQSLKDVLTAAAATRKRSHSESSVGGDSGPEGFDGSSGGGGGAAEKPGKKRSTTRAPKGAGRGRGTGGRRRGRQSKDKANGSRPASADAKTPQLYEAIKQGNVAEVRKEISLGTPLDAADVLGRSPLHLCAQYNQIEIARLVLEAGTDVDPIGPRRSTPLHLAAEASHRDMVALLLEYGSDFRCENDLGHTAEHVAKDPIITSMLADMANASTSDSRSGRASQTPVADYATFEWQQSWDDLGHAQSGAEIVDGIEFTEFAPKMIKQPAFSRYHICLKDQYPGVNDEIQIIASEKKLG